MADIQRREDLSCLALFILTHGEENGLLFGYDTSYRLNRDIVQELLPQQCPGLVGKPKFIFVQVICFEELSILPPFRNKTTLISV